MSGKMPDWLLERYALGELPPERLAEVHARLLADPAEAERLAALQRSNEEILARYPTKQVVGRLRRSVAPKVPRALWLAPVLLAAVALFVAVPTVVAPPVNPAPEDVRVKGLVPALALFRDARGAAEPIEEGALVGPGEVVQLRVQNGGRPYGVVVSIDGRGGVTVHFPRPGGTVALPSGEHPLPDAFQLDDAPRFERFFLVTSDAPVAVDSVVAAAQTLAAGTAADTGALDLEPALAQTSFLLRKE